MVYVKPEVLAQKAARHVFAAGSPRPQGRACLDD